MKKPLSILLVALLVFSTFSILAAVPLSAATDEYFIYSKFDPPGIADVVGAGGYVEYYGVPEWGDEIQYVYFLSGTTGYKVKVWVTDGDGDGKIEPRQHPNHYLSEFRGPIEPRHFQIVSSKDLTGYTAGSGGHSEEFYVDSSGVYLGAYPYGINKWDHDWNYIGKIANSPPERTESMAYNPAENVWYAGGRYRTIYELRDTDNDGSFLDESWRAIFTYPDYGGDHHDGMEYVGGYLWISDMTSDVIGKWWFNPTTHAWEELKRFTYSEVGDVEGMGFGPNDHFWIGSGWGDNSYIYELGNEITKGYPIADAGPDVDNHPPTIPIKFDASGSHHTDPTKQIVLYEWDFESDGTWDYSGTDLIVEHAYPAYYNPDGSIDWTKTAKNYTATLRVTDNSDPPLRSTDTCIVHITAPPWPPVADPNGPYEGTVGTPIQLDGSKSYDPESTMFPPNHPWYETIAKYEWDLDYDGIKEHFNVDATGIKPSWTWNTEGKYIIGLRVTDSQPSGPSSTFGPLDVDIKVTTVVIKKVEEWSFAIITDLHIGFGYPDYGPEGFDECERMDDSAILRLCEDYYLTDRLTKIVEAINNNPQIKFVVVLGDISDSAEYSEFLKAREILNMLNVPYIPILGNHDVWPYTQKAEQLPSSELLNLLKLLDGLDILDLSDPELRELFQDLIMYWWDPYIPLSLPYPSSPLHYLPDAREDKEQNANSARGDIYFNEIFWGERNMGNIQKIHSVFGNSFRRQHTDLHTLLDTGKAQILMNYVFTYNGVKFIILDCNARKADTAGAQLFTETKEWLKENLKSDEPTIIFSHHPLIFSDLPLLGEQCFSLAEADEIRDIIEASGAIVLKTFGGHTHANFVVSPGYKHSKIIDWEVSIPLTTKKIKLKAGFGVENRLKIDVVITEAVSRESIRWMKWLAQNWEDYSKFPFRSETGKCIRIVTMLGKELVSYSKLDSVAEEPNLPPTSYFTYWPAQQSIKKFTAFPYDPDGNPEECTYSWDYGGNWKGVFRWESGGRTPCIRYTKAGVYTATLTVTDGGGAVSRPFSRPVTVHSKAEISTHSPVDLIVTDPEGVVFTKNSSEALGVSYVELDIDGDGSLDDIVAILEPKIGDYLITVVPEPNANLTDIYTIEVWVNGTTTIFGENVQIKNIPMYPYIVRFTETDVIPIIPATADFNPNTLNLKSKGNWVTVYIELPVGHGYDVSMINLTTVMLNGQVYAEAKPFAIGDYDSDGIPDLMVKFNRAAVQAILQVDDQVEITISGKLTDGRVFEGKDTIQVILPALKQ